MRRKAYCLISSEQTKRLLDSLKTQCPAIAGYVRDLFPLHTITGIFRELAAEGVSLRNMRKVCECLAAAAADPDPVARVRAGMARELTSQISRSSGVAVVYLLDKPIVDVLSSDEHLPEDSADRVRKAIRTELQQLPATASSPALLTPPDLRRSLRALTSIEFPNTPVVTYAELANDFSVQPVGRITF
jgi:type III secretion protein V